MLAAAQRFFEQLDAFDGALSLGSQLGAAEGETQVFQPLVVAAGDGTQTAGLMVSSRGFCILLHVGFNRVSIANVEIALTECNCRAALGLDSRGRLFLPEQLRTEARGMVHFIVYADNRKGSECARKS